MIFDMLTLVLQSLLTCFLTWLAFRVTIRPVDVSNKKKLFAHEAIVVISALAIVVLGFIQFWQQEQESRESRRTVSTLTNEVKTVQLQLWTRIAHTKATQML